MTSGPELEQQFAETVRLLLKIKPIRLQNVVGQTDSVVVIDSISGSKCLSKFVCRT